MTQLDGDGFGVDTARGVVVYHRWGPGADGVLERFYVALNFSGQPQTVTLSFAENGTWEDLLNGGPAGGRSWISPEPAAGELLGPCIFQALGGVLVSGRVLLFGRW
jgi:hypothetical protein